MIRVLLLTAAGPEHGIGHLRRSRWLAAELARRPAVEVDLRTLGSEGAAAGAQVAAACDVLVVDPPPALVGPPLLHMLREVRRRGRPVVGIDAPHDDVDLLVVPSFVVAPDLLRALAAAGTAIVWGWDALLIGPRAAPPTGIVAAGAPVLVLTGGSDAAGLGRTLPGLLDAALPSGTTVDWVTGPLAPPPELPAAPRVVWREHRAPEDLRPLMSRARAALAVYGVSVLELLHHGVPTVALSPYGDRDVLQLDHLEREGLALVAGTAPAAAAGLTGLLSDPVGAVALGQRAAARIPAPGTARVADAILALAAR